MSANCVNEIDQKFADVRKAHDAEIAKLKKEFNAKMKSKATSARSGNVVDIPQLPLKNRKL
jgi:hypothetical protein